MLEGILMQKNKEIMSWLKNTWMKHREELDNGSWNVRTKNSSRMMASGEAKQKSTPEILWIGEKKEYMTNGIIREDNMKLEPWIFERTGKI